MRLPLTRSENIVLTIIIILLTLCPLCRPLLVHLADYIVNLSAFSSMLKSRVSLILAFGLYFIFQHSLNAWGHLQHGLKIDGFSLYKKALPFTLSAIFFLCAMLIYNSVAVLNLNKFIATLFIFLSCISLPHFLLMHLFYKVKHEE